MDIGVSCPSQKICPDLFAGDRGPAGRDYLGVAPDARYITNAPKYDFANFYPHISVAIP